MKIPELQSKILEAWENRALLSDATYRVAIEAVIDLLESGQLRVAEPLASDWQVNEWVKKAVILYFPIRGMETTHAGPMEFYDKMKLKSG